MCHILTCVGIEKAEREGRDFKLAAADWHERLLEGLNACVPCAILGLELRRWLVGFPGIILLDHWNGDAIEVAGTADFEFKSHGVANGRFGGGYLTSDVEIPDRAGETRRTALPRQGQNLHRRGPAVEGDLFLRRRAEEVIKEWIVEKWI